MGVAVAPCDVAANHPGLFVVALVVGAVEREVAQRGELGLDPVQPRRVERHVRELDVVRADAQERTALNAILHPLIGQEVRRRIERLEGQGHAFALYEAALIVENRLQHGLDGLVVVTAPVGEQIRRLLLRDGLSEEDARARIAAQLPQSEKVAEADFVIENTGAPELLRAQVARVLDALQAGYSRRAG